MAGCRRNKCCADLFYRHAEVDNIRLIDGAVWANNPTVVAVIEAFGTLNVPLSCIRVLSLGTSEEICDRKKNLDLGGFWQWKDAAVDIVLRGQTLAAINHSRFLMGKEKLVGGHDGVYADLSL